jgi:p-hydroxybenzoate 3-monooxygenase
VVKDLIEARLAAGGHLEFDVSGTEVDDLDTDAPVLRYTSADGTRREVTCDAIAGCDGFHGICRPAVPAALLTVWEREYPYAWLGILADVPPSTDELIYAHHPDGFALHSLRSPLVSRLYLQVAPDEEIGAWPDDRIWAELQRRFAVPGWELKEGPVLDKGITPMRSFVSAPMRYGRLFLAGDAAHIVPPTGAKGLNLALGDVEVLAAALQELLRGDAHLAAHPLLVVDDHHAARHSRGGPHRRTAPAGPAPLRHRITGGRGVAGRELHRLPAAAGTRLIRAGQPVGAPLRAYSVSCQPFLWTCTKLALK